MATSNIGNRVWFTFIGLGDIVPIELTAVANQLSDFSNEGEVNEETFNIFGSLMTRSVTTSKSLTATGLIQINTSALTDNFKEVFEATTPGKHLIDVYLQQNVDGTTPNDIATKYTKALLKVVRFGYGSSTDIAVIEFEVMLTANNDPVTNGSIPVI